MTFIYIVADSSHSFFIAEYSIHILLLNLFHFVSIVEFNSLYFRHFMDFLFGGIMNKASMKFLYILFDGRVFFNIYLF